MNKKVGLLVCLFNCLTFLLATAQNTSNLSEVCKKYGKAVYAEYHHPITGDILLRDTCTAVEPTVIGGDGAASREYPHMALIGYGEKASVKWSCGGSLISERYVISAAHCSYPRRSDPAKWVRLGEHNIKSTQDDEKGNSNPTDYEIIQITNHPEYKWSSKYNDISLYKLNTDVVFNEYIRPICLPMGDQLTNIRYAIATGWGYTEWGSIQSDILQEVNLTITATNDCSKFYAKESGLSSLRDGIRHESQMCAGDYGKDTCQGDSGGPLQIRNVKPHCTYSLVGITSFGMKCGEIPGVYTRVSHFLPWIESVVWP